METDWKAMLYDNCATGVANDIADCVERAFAEMRERTLVEATTAATPAGRDDWGPYFIEAGGTTQSLFAAKRAVEALTTPTAQAEVRKRIVAEWLEERGGRLHETKDSWLADANHKLAGEYSALCVLLAALKESE